MYRSVPGPLHSHRNQPLIPTHPLGVTMQTRDTATPNIRGVATRLSLQNAFLVLFETTAWRSLTVIDIARTAGVSPATVYQYHPHMDSLALAAAERLESAGAKLTPRLSALVSLLRSEVEEGLL